MGELKQRGNIWWIRYCRNGRRYEESTRSKKKGDAVNLLKLREGDSAKGLPVTPAIGRLTFDDAIADVQADYTTNGKRSADAVERRTRLHLLPFLGGKRMVAITTADLRRFTAHRQAQGASNAEINRELALVKRAYRLAMQAGKLLTMPHVPMLKEANTRSGFFEADQFVSVKGHLPTALQPIVEFAYITGWRVDSEILPLEWRQVDFTAGEVRLDPHSTKNGEGRVFPMTDDLRALLEPLHTAYEARQKAGQLAPWVFVRMVAKGRRGPKAPKPIKRFDKAWKAAAKAAGCPAHIRHDFRRSAVRNMVRRGVPERVAMLLTGHKTRSVFERYNIVSEGDMKTAAIQLAGLTGTGMGQSATGTADASPQVVQFAKKIGGAARI